MLFNGPVHVMLFADSLALLKAGSSIDAKIAMIAITTRSSMSVNLNDLHMIQTLLFLILILN
jgi:hypothetical protein